MHPSTRPAGGGPQLRNTAGHHSNPTPQLSSSSHTADHQILQHHPQSSTTPQQPHDEVCSSCRKLLSQCTGGDANSTNGLLGGSNAGAALFGGNDSIGRICWQRLSVLVSLLLLQSLSQFVLESYESLISANLVIPLFLTMLVGAGGNAGNQAAVRSITGLVTGEFRVSHMASVLKKEVIVGLICSTVLFGIGYMRVYFYYTNEDTQPTPVGVTVFSISLSLWLIVFTSVVVGAALPFLLKKIGLNIEHAAPMIQVLMDISGVFICCFVCSLLLPAPSVNSAGVVGADGASTPPVATTTTPAAGAAAAAKEGVGVAGK